MKINDNIEMLTLPGNNGLMHPVVIHDSHHMILVDSGLPWQIDLIKDELLSSGFNLDNLDAIVFTHQDLDHIGSAKEIREVLPRLKTMAYVDEVDFISGRKTPTKLAELAANLDNLTAAQKLRHDWLKDNFINSFIDINVELHNHEIIPYCGGIEVIHTPGHTVGHICLYAEAAKTLICGDALNINNGELSGSNPIYTLDMKMSQESIRKLASYDIEYIVTYHGGFIDNGHEAIIKLIDSFS